MDKKLMWFLVFVGGTVGSYVPALWGDSSFSIAGIFFGGVGSFLGIYIAYQISTD